MAPSPPSTEVVASMQYDPNVRKRSIEDPIRQHRRSSIPFADRTPAVRFIRAIEQRKSSLSGPYLPKVEEPSKTILKKSNHPILVTPSGHEVQQIHSDTSHISTTNDELETCRLKAELIMDKASRSERLARGAMDVLTFPTATRRVEALSRLQGCVTICVCIIQICVTSDEFQSKQPPDMRKSICQQLNGVVEMVQKIKNEAISLCSTAKQFLTFCKHRYNDWEELFKRNNEFKIDHSKLNYPIYTHKRMPESVTLFEDALDEHNVGMRNRLDGYIRAFRKYPEGTITIHCDMAEKSVNAVEEGGPQDFVTFQDCPLETQVEIIQYIVSHMKDLLTHGNLCLTQGLQAAQDLEMDDAFKYIHQKINNLEYDNYFDPLCALELKTALGELVMRKAELLNTAEQILEHCRHTLEVIKSFSGFTKRSITGRKTGCWCCSGATTYKNLLHLLGMVSIDDVTILMPLTVDIAQDIFQVTTFQISRESKDYRTSVEHTQHTHEDQLNE